MNSEKDLNPRALPSGSEALRSAGQTVAMRAGQREGNLESRVAGWVCSRIGVEHMHSRERAMRLLEEAIELAQAEGITWQMCANQMTHVYNRPPGEPAQEAAGVAVCLLAWCAATGHRLHDIAVAEIERIEAKPLDQIRGSLARKGDADLITACPAHDCSRSAMRELGYILRAALGDTSLEVPASDSNAPSVDGLAGDVSPRTRSVVEEEKVSSSQEKTNEST